MQSPVCSLSSKSAGEIFDLYYCEVRSHLLEAAAALDRFDRYDPEGTLRNDPRYAHLMAALDILRDGKRDRAERFLNAFSVPDNAPETETRS